MILSLEPLRSWASTAQGRLLGWLIMVMILILPVLYMNRKCNRAYAIYRKSFKEKIIKSIVKLIDEKLEYFCDGFVDQNTFLKSKLFKKYPDEYSGDDLIKGRIGDTEVEFSEIEALYKTRKITGKVEWHIIFSGLFFIADFNKYFNNDLVILPDIAEKKLGYIGKMMQSINPDRDRLIKMEDPEFEKIFVVYGKDQIEARYILTPALMSRITAFHKTCEGNIYISFIGSKINIAISYSRNLFEPRLFWMFQKHQQMEKYYRDLEFIMGIVNQLNLNTRIWSKQPSAQTGAHL